MKVSRLTVVGRLFVGLGTALVIVPGSTAANEVTSTPIPVDVISEIRQRLVAVMSRDQVPSISVAAALRNKLVWSEAYGTADVENFVPATRMTKYRTASIDKWMTATAAMRLVEAGQLSLNAMASEHCEVFPRKRWPVRVHHLLNHTSGIRHYWITSGVQRYWGGENPQGVADEFDGFLVRHTDRLTPVSAFSDDPLLFKPGSHHLYSSHGYRLLGCILAGASGETYTALMKKLIFDPAGMKHTTPDDSWSIIPHRAPGYSLTEDRSLRRARFRDVSENLPAGGHLSTPTDLVRFAAAFNSGRLANASSVQSMLARPSISPKDEHSYYGFGIKVRLSGAEENTTGETVLYHSGHQAGTTTLLMLIPSQGIVWAIMMNHDKTSWADIGWPVLALLKQLSAIEPLKDEAGA